MSIPNPSSRKASPALSNPQDVAEADKNPIQLSPASQRRRANEIEAMLAKEKAAYKDRMSEPRLLLLGSGDSGKTTFLKQLRVLHGGGFTKEERQANMDNILANIFDSITTLIQRVNGDIDVFSNEIQDAMQSITEVTRTLENNQQTDIVERMRIFLQLAPKINMVWKDECIQRMYKRAGQLKIQVQDTAYYFLDKVMELAEPNYVPTDEDILHVRAPTTQISKHVIKINNLPLHIFDVAGQQKHRKQWTPYFDDVHSIIFVASLASYDQVLVEDPTINRMHDALKLFGEICNHTLLKHIPITLFLNKKDLFEKKLAASEIATFFPDYRGQTNVKKAQRYFEKKFASQNSDDQKKVFIHTTCCTDTDAMRVIIASVLDSSLKSNLKVTGLME